MQPEPPAQVLGQLHVEEIPVELPEQGQEVEEGKQRYALIDPRGGEELVPVLAAEDSIAASEAFLLPELWGTGPFPPWTEDGEPQVPPGDEIRCYLTKDGERFVVAPWPFEGDREVTHVKAWRGFTVQDRMGFHDVWRRLRRREI